MTNDSSRHDLQRAVSDFLQDMPVVSFYGILLDDVAPGLCTLRLPFRPELSHDGRAFQASISGALADFAGGIAIVTLLPGGHVVATTGYQLHLVAPASGTGLIARGRSIRVGRTSSLAQSDVFAISDGREKLCATAFVSLRTVPPPAHEGRLQEGARQ